MDEYYEYEISMIMPALNEEENIKESIDNCVESLEALNINGEIIVVNDGSHDNTGQIVEDMMKQNPNIRIITNKFPNGVGTSFWKGVQSAKGEIVVFIPGDAENDSYETLKYIHLLEHTDLVIPYVYNKCARSLFRRILSKTYKYILNFSFGIEIKYLNGTVMYRKKILRNIKLHSTGFFFQAELIVKSLRSGYLYAEVPYKIKQRVFGDSKAVKFKSLMVIFKDYLHILIDNYIGKKSFIESGTATAKIKNSLRDRL